MRLRATASLKAVQSLCEADGRTEACCGMLGVRMGRVRLWATTSLSQSRSSGSVTTHHHPFLLYKLPAREDEPSNLLEAKAFT